jgi:hypothetical protein
MSASAYKTIGSRIMLLSNSIANCVLSLATSINTIEKRQECRSRLYVAPMAIMIANSGSGKSSDDFKDG